MPIHVLDGVPHYDAELDGLGAVDVSALLDNIGKGVNIVATGAQQGMDIASRWKDSEQSRRLMRENKKFDAQIADADARAREADAKYAALQYQIANQNQGGQLQAGGMNSKKMLLIGGGVLALGLVMVLLLKKK